ncbi:hypothetical protein A2V71_02135 [Candidatus Berkelbacteria bacterium RBG_13_40_8]|uniref:Uncharacterized protein n=1 Tax=Candidatus Berkelbacteria bacterium RBG_13_40_8 TaxID=1797467 RepID=A0A1F5DQ00_9BACT|nr:MAG: hypothetical protein A2V71_02135 [Candidatus Berkelbacteria bacterium RBG_13_40_8]
MLVFTAPQDTWALNMVRAVYGESLRLSTYSRTSTIVDGCPLNVDSSSAGVDARRRWGPEFAHPDIAASVQGVPGNFVP